MRTLYICDTLRYVWCAIVCRNETLSSITKTKTRSQAVARTADHTASQQTI